MFGGFANGCSADSQRIRNIRDGFAKMRDDVRRMCGRIHNRCTADSRIHTRIHNRFTRVLILCSNMFTVLRRKCVYGISRITHETRVSVTRLTR